MKSFKFGPCNLCNYSVLCAVHRKDTGYRWWKQLQHIQEHLPWASLSFPKLHRVAWAVLLPPLITGHSAKPSAFRWNLGMCKHRLWETISLDQFGSQLFDQKLKLKLLAKKNGVCEGRRSVSFSSQNCFPEQLCDCSEETKSHELGNYRTGALISAIAKQEPSKFNAKFASFLVLLLSSPRKSPWIVKHVNTRTEI